MISFSDLSLYLEEKLKQTEYELYSYTQLVGSANDELTFPEHSDHDSVLDGEGNTIETNLREIMHDYKFRFYDNGGDLVDIVNDMPPETIVVNIVDDGITQNTQTPVNVYLHSIILQFLAKEEYREDLNTILRVFSTEYKSHTDEFKSKRIQTIVEEYPGLTSREFNGEQYIAGQMDFFVLVWDDLKVSNTTHIYLNPEDLEQLKPEAELQFSSMKSQRQYKTTSNLKKLEEIPSVHETSQFQIDIMGIYKDTELMRGLKRDHFTNSNFGTPYRVVITEEGEADPIRDGYFIVANSVFFQAYGQTITYSLSLIPYEPLT